MWSVQFYHPRQGPLRWDFTSFELAAHMAKALHSDRDMCHGKPHLRLGRPRA